MIEESQSCCPIRWFTLINNGRPGPRSHKDHPVALYDLLNQQHTLQALGFANSLLWNSPVRRSRGFEFKTFTQNTPWDYEYDAHHSSVAYVTSSCFHLQTSQRTGTSKYNWHLTTEIWDDIKHRSWWSRDLQVLYIIYICNHIYI